MRILIAEDHPSLGPSLKQGLERSHYAVDLVANGDDALLLGRAVPYDLVILDVMLPGINGFEVCRQLRDCKRSMPILFLTALGTRTYIKNDKSPIHGYCSRHQHSRGPAWRSAHYPLQQGICPARISHVSPSSGAQPYDDCRTRLGCRCRAPF